MSSTGNETLTETVSGRAFQMATDLDRAKFYRRHAERANRDYEKGRQEAIDYAISLAQRGSRKPLTAGEIAEARAVGKRHWSEHMLGKTFAADASYYREMTIFYATLHNNGIGR